MAEDESTQTVTSEGAETPQGQAAEPASQEAVQGQGTEQSQVDTTDKGASSGGHQKSNGSWAVERIVERALKKHLGGLEERLTAARQSPSEPSAKADEIGQPDYNDLNGWLSKAVEKMLDERLKQNLPKITGEFESKLKRTSAIQEARNYLISQKDIGENEDRLAEVEQIILKDRILQHAVDTMPLDVVKEATKRWRSGKTSPNVPSKGQLSTVVGGTPAGTKKEPTIAELKAMQAKLASNLTQEETEKIHAEIDSMFK